MIISTQPGGVNAISNHAAMEMSLGEFRGKLITHTDRLLMMPV